jgi:hypothetical protein
MGIFFIPDSKADEVLTGGMEHIHLNMKEANDLSPETWGDNTKEAIKENPPRSWENFISGEVGRTREWKDIGTWTTTDGVNFDIGLGGPVKFNLWWRETDEGQDDSYDAQVQYRFRLNIDGQDAAFYTDEGGGSHECAESEPCEWTGEVGNINITSAEKGATFDIEIEYWAFSDIEIYYDNVTFDSGVAFSSNAIKFGKSKIDGRTVGFDFVQAWNTKVEEAVEGNYISLLLPGGEELNNLEQSTGYPKVEDGYSYDFNGTEIMSTMVTWYVDDEYAKLDQVSFSFSLLDKDSTQAPPIVVNIADIPMLGSGGSEKDDALLPGFEIILSIVAIAFVARRANQY